MDRLQNFSEVVEAIYDCALAPANWSDAIVRIADYVGSDATAIDFMDLTINEPVAGFSIGYGDGYRRSLLETYVRLWMLQSQFHRWPVGQPMHLDDILPADEFRAGRFYREWCRPQGHGDYIGLIAFSDTTRFVKMTNARLISRGDYPGEAVDRFRLLAPHICRSVAISDAFDLQAVGAQMIESTLDSLSVPVFVTDEQCCVLHANRAALALLDSSAALDLRDGRLHPADSEARANLCGAVSNHLSPAPGGPCGTSVAMPDPEGLGGLAAFVLPLEGKVRRSLAGEQHAAAAVVVRSPSAAALRPDKSLAVLYGLTSAEMRVAEAIVQGLSLRQAAEVLGVSPNTVKTQLRSIFAKTGVKRQSQLVSLVLSLVPPGGAQIELGSTGHSERTLED